MNVESISNSDRLKLIAEFKLQIRAALVKIRTVATIEEPEHELMLAVFGNALEELLDPYENADATDYIRYDLTHLELIGVNKDWARQQLHAIGISKLYDQGELISKLRPSHAPRDRVAQFRERKKRKLQKAKA